MSYNSTMYDASYYSSHLGTDYSRGNGWEEVFSRHANNIVRDFNPQKTLDVGCAVGYFVEGLRDLGVEAYGIDISEFAISQVREDVKPFCKVQNAKDNIAGKYDLITCIEVLEHMSIDDIKKAIFNMCQVTDKIIFSSTPFDYEEGTHFSVNKAGFWSEQFAANGFYHDIDYDCSYIAPQCRLYRKRDLDKIELVRNYEDKLFELWNQCCVLRNSLNLSTAKIIEMERTNNQQIDSIEKNRQEIIAEKKELDNKYAIALKDNYEKMDALHDVIIEQRDSLELLQKQLDDAMKHSVLHYNLAQIGKDSAIKRFFTTRRLFKKSYEYWKPVFDAAAYVKYNADVSAIFGDSKEKLLKHFIKQGMYEARRASESFEINTYLKYNTDVAELYKNDLRSCYIHFIENGMKEGRKSI